MKFIRHFVQIVDRQTLIVTLLAMLSTWLCDRYGLHANMPTGLIGVAIVFPIVFSINAAYRRREEALRYFASFKAHAISVYYAHRDWAPLEDSEREAHAARFRSLFEDLLIAVRDFFRADKEDEPAGFRRVYKIFSSISKSHEILRSSRLPANEVSRMNQYLRAIVIEFERMRNIKRYRTPIALRAYSQIFLNSFPILFGPYFAYLADKSNAYVGYAVAVLYSLVLVSLDNIQEKLENPFDGIGVDDIRLDVVDDYLPMMKPDDGEPHS